MQAENNNLSPLIKQCYPAKVQFRIILHLFKIEHEKEKLKSIE